MRMNGSLAAVHEGTNFIRTAKAIPLSINVCAIASPALILVVFFAIFFMALVSFALNVFSSTTFKRL